jgi:hypothetical protein
MVVGKEDGTKVGTNEGFLMTLGLYENKEEGFFVGIFVFRFGENVGLLTGVKQLCQTHFSCSTHIDPEQVAYGLQQSLFVLHPHSA